MTAAEEQLLANELQNFIIEERQMMAVAAPDVWLVVEDPGNPMEADIVLGLFHTEKEADECALKNNKIARTAPRGQWTWIAGYRVEGPYPAGTYTSDDEGEEFEDRNENGNCAC